MILSYLTLYLSNLTYVAHGTGVKNAGLDVRTNVLQKSYDGQCIGQRDRRLLSILPAGGKVNVKIIL